MLGRAGISAVLVDPHASYPPDFRVEKIGGDEQIERLGKTGLLDAVLRKATVADENWIARFGHLLDKAPRQQFGILYDTLVNAIRAEIPPASNRSSPRPSRSRPRTIGRRSRCPTTKPFPRGWW